MTGYELIQIFGAFVCLMGMFNLSRALIKRRWPETVAVIQRNEVREVTSSIFSLFWLGPLSNFSSKSYADTDKEKVLMLSYVYVVDGFKYVGNQLYSAPIIQVRCRPGGIREGSKVKVFYNPGNPGNAFLAHSFAWPSMVVILLGVIIIGGTTYMQFQP